MATGGRLGPCRTTDSRDHSTRTGPALLVGQPARQGRHRRAALAAERAAVGERRRRHPPGIAPTGVGLEIGGLHPRRAERERPLAVGDVDRVAQGHRAVAARHGAGAPARLAQARRRFDGFGAGRQRHQRARGCRVVGEAAAAQHDRRTGRLEGRAPRPRRARRRGPGRGRRGVRPPETGARRAASTIDCHPVQRHRCADRAVRTAASSAPPRRCSSEARRITIPGVQKPHWLAPVSTNASVQRRRRSSGSPSTVVTARPATRRVAVTHETRGEPSTQTVQHPHWPWGLQPSLTDTQPRCSRSASRSEEPSSGTQTADPFSAKPTSPVAEGSLS